MEKKKFLEIIHFARSVLYKLWRCHPRSYKEDTRTLVIEWIRANLSNHKSEAKFKAAVKEQCNKWIPQQRKEFFRDNKQHLIPDLLNKKRTAEATTQKGNKKPKGDCGGHDDDGSDSEGDSSGDSDGDSAGDSVEDGAGDPESDGDSDEDGANADCWRCWRRWCWWQDDGEDGEGQDNRKPKLKDEI